ncbi:hypothetical protein BX616_007204, partial [Lobosporangium transversale]
MAEPKDHFTAENVAPIMIPALRELAPVHHPYENNTKDRSSLHEQDSLSVLANLATHTLLLPKLEPKEISREKTRWVEDDRRLSRVHRRLSDIERQCVRSGSVYCFDEREAGMRRWTDGKSWSPSRVTGSFLTYRELDDSQGNHTGKNVYRDKGLLKQSFSITTVDNQKLHLISYFTNDDVHSERLRITPSTDPRFADIMVPKGIYPETPSVTSATAEPTLPTVQQSSPSPNMPYRNRQRPQQRPNQEEEDPSSLRADAKAGPHHHRRSDSSSSMHSSGH